MAAESAGCSEPFVEELASVCEAILRKPLILKPYRDRRGIVVRRWRLEETEQHVYYTADVVNGLIIVLRIWGARRGRGPRL